MRTEYIIENPHYDRMHIYFHKVNQFYLIDFRRDSVPEGYVNYVVSVTEHRNISTERAPCTDVEDYDAYFMKVCCFVSALA